MINATTSLKKQVRKQKRAIALENKRPKSEFDKVIRKMDKEEINEYFCLMVSGQWDVRNKTILMGENAMNRLIEFQNRMIAKYSSF